MINLLPPETQETYRYARRNAGLLRWLITGGVGLLGLAAISLAGIIYIQQATRTYAQQAAANSQSLASQNQAGTDKEAKAISGSIKLAVQVLSKEILFSSLIKQIGTITPDNASLSNLNISQTKGALDITAQTADYNAAAQLQTNLADPANKIFAKADIVSITCSSGSKSAAAAGTVSSRYPCTVVIRALFVDNNPFLFINTSSTARKVAAHDQ